MTGGIVTVLGTTGVNFAAGMTGGFAYVLDECGNFAKRTNPELVELLDVADLAIHQEHLRGIITAHLNETGSSRAEEILANFDSYVPKFRLIKPKSSDVKSLLGHQPFQCRTQNPGAIRREPYEPERISVYRRAAVDPPKKPLKIRKIQFVEIYESFNQAQVGMQADRCLDCGNPYCSGSARYTTTSPTG